MTVKSKAHVKPGASEQDGAVYVTQTGITVELQPVPPTIGARIIQGMVADPNWGPEPQPPTYKAETVGGGYEEHELTQEIIESPDATEEEKAAYFEYKRKAQAWRIECMGRQVRAILDYGVRARLPEDDSWIRRARRIGIPIPEDPDELQVLYVELEVLRSKKDVEGVMGAISSLTGLTEADLAVAQDMFQR